MVPLSGEVVAVKNDESAAVDVESGTDVKVGGGQTVGFCRLGDQADGGGT